jgi:cytochrome oxidase Cu insertion factor (SCO1/SenC/PrrC family)
VVGATFLLGALVQALPRSGFWTPTGLGTSLAEVASSGVPEPLATPIQTAASVLPDHVAVVNGALVALLAVVGVGLLVDVLPRATVGAGIALSAFAWWFGQGFGIFGGTGTDPDTGLVTILVLLAGWPWPAVAVGPAEEPLAVEPAARPAYRGRVAAGAAALAALVVLPLVAGLGLLGPQTAQAAVGDSGGVAETAPVPAPDFELTDQDGRPLAMHDLRGTLTLVAFLDPECTDSCPLIANELASAARGLGADAGSVSILAVDVNPVFNTVADVAAFTRAHGLDTLPGWHFVTGPTARVGALLAAYGEGVSMPDVGMIGHPQDVYLVGRDGTELAVLNDTANEDLTASYVELIGTELRRHL